MRFFCVFATLLIWIATHGLSSAMQEQKVAEEGALEESYVCTSDKKPSRNSYKEKASADAVYRCAFVVPDECVGGLKFRERVVLSFHITMAGKPENISIIKSTNSCLDNEAIRTLSLWRYEPLQEPELGAKVTFKVYSHSDTHENHRTMREIGRFN